MKWLAQVTLLMIALGAITLAGAAQDNSAPAITRSAVREGELSKAMKKGGKK